MTIVHALDKRYEFNVTNKKLIDELTWLKKVRNIIIKEQKKRNGKLSGYNLNLLIKNDLDRFIKKLEAAKGDNSLSTSNTQS